MLQSDPVLLYHTFPWIVLSWDYIFIPYDFLSWIQRHLVQLLNLRNPTFMTRYLKETGPGRKLEAFFSIKIIYGQIHQKCGMRSFMFFSYSSALQEIFYPFFHLSPHKSKMQAISIVMVFGIRQIWVQLPAPLLVSYVKARQVFWVSLILLAFSVKKIKCYSPLRFLMKMKWNTRKQLSKCLAQAKILETVALSFHQCKPKKGGLNPRL